MKNNTRLSIASSVLIAIGILALASSYVASQGEGERKPGEGPEYVPTRLPDSPSISVTAITPDRRSIKRIPSEREIAIELAAQRSRDAANPNKDVVVFADTSPNPAVNSYRSQNIFIGSLSRIDAPQMVKIDSNLKTSPSDIGGIYRIAKVKVIQSLKGTAVPGDEFSILIPGGEVDGHRVVFEDYRIEIKLNSESVYYLSPAPSELLGIKNLWVVDDRLIYDSVAKTASALDQTYTIDDLQTMIEKKYE